MECGVSDTPDTSTRMPGRGRRWRWLSRVKSSRQRPAEGGSDCIFYLSSISHSTRPKENRNRALRSTRCRPFEPGPRVRWSAMTLVQAMGEDLSGRFISNCDQTACLGQPCPAARLAPSPFNPLPPLDTSSPPPTLSPPKNFLFRPFLFPAAGLLIPHVSGPYFTP